MTGKMFRVVNKDDFSPLIIDRDPEKGGWFTRSSSTLNDCTKVQYRLRMVYKGQVLPIMAGQRPAHGVQRSSITMNDCIKVQNRMRMVYKGQLIP
jgi:hypothetical protein